MRATRAAGHAPDARWIPMGEVAARQAELPDDRDIVVVCRVGARSAQVAAWLTRQGYDAVNLTGGMEAWVQAGRPIVGPDGTHGVII